MKRTLCVFALVGVMSSLASADTITAIDLNDFFPDPEVTVAVDGSTADFVESGAFFSVGLFNDPSFSFEPYVIVPAPGRLLRFEFDFDEPTGNDDIFTAFLVNSVSGGFPISPAFDFLASSTSSGTVTFDLSSLVPDADSSTGLIFQLNALPGDGFLDSTLTISNVRLVDPDVIPEPSAWALFGLAAAVLAWRRRR